ncbi:MAG: PilZ domain-containing protein [Phycisphaerales bacterium]
MPYIYERREDERYALARGMKLLDPRAQRYRPGRTLNVSASGALVETRGGEHLPAGQPIRLAIDWAGSAKLMNRGDLIDATVVRHDGRGGETSLLAVRFNQRLSLATAA